MGELGLEGSELAMARYMDRARQAQSRLQRLS